MMVFSNGTKQLHLFSTGEEDYRAHRHTNTVFVFILEVVSFLPSLNTLKHEGSIYKCVHSMALKRLHFQEGDAQVNREEKSPRKFQYILP